jgi:hypothetical protein
LPVLDNQQQGLRRSFEHMDIIERILAEQQQISKRTLFDDP